VCRTAAVVRAVVSEGQGASSAAGLVLLPVQVRSCMELHLPLGADSASLVHDSLAVYAAGELDEGEGGLFSATDALTVDTIVPEHGENEAWTRAEATSRLADASLRFSMFRVAAVAGRAEHHDTPAATGHALHLAPWLQELVAEHPHLVSSNTAGSAAAAAHSAMLSAAKSSEQEQQRIAAEKRSKSGAAAATQRATKVPEGERSLTGGDGSLDAGAEGATKSTEAKRSVKTSKKGRDAGASASAEGGATSAADFFASMLSSPEPKAKEKPKTRATRSTRSSKQAK